jgi:TPR repeat protein
MASTPRVSCLTSNPSHNGWRLAALSGVLVGTLPLLSACGGGNAASQVRPEAPTAANALGEPGEGDSGECHDVQNGGRPLIVDWRPEQRGDLEVAMGQGIAVVHYSCHGLELLPDCMAEGSYGFKGIVLKQQLIRLENADELRANLPLSGAALAAKLSAEFASGTTLDLATALVGNLTASRFDVARTDLAGRCDGATHFVRGANIGAFVMQTGERAQATSAAQIFSAGAEGASSSRKLARTEDGQLESCKESNADAAKPPANCGALVRVHLLPLSGGGGSGPQGVKPATEERAELEADCPAGLVSRGGKCARLEAAVAHECAPGDQADCEAQCQKNQPLSCARLARILSSKVGDASAQTRASGLFEKACGPDAPGACSDLAILRLSQSPGAATEVQASGLFEQACKLGESNGCFNLGNLYYDGRGVTADKQRAFALFSQACNAGKPAGCINAGNMYDDGEGVAADPKQAFTLFKKACEGGEPVGCSNLAYMYGEGRGTVQDQAAATRTYEKACALGNSKGCAYAATRYEQGQGVAADATKAQGLRARACKLGLKESCEK